MSRYSVGAGDSTGGAIARRFAREGYTAVVTRRHADKLKGLADRIMADGGKVHAFGSDARDEAQVVELFQKIESEIGEIEVGEDAASATTDHGATGEGDDRHPHPERVASGDAAVIGKRVQADIDGVVAFQVFFTGLLFHQQEALPRDVMALERIQHLAPAAGAARRSCWCRSRCAERI